MAECTRNGRISLVRAIIPSGLAAIVLATVPLWMVVFDKDGWKQNSSNPYIGGGLGIGVTGVALLSDYDMLGYLSDNRELFYLGLIVLLGGTLCWSWGSLYSKKTSKNVSLPMNLAIQMGTAGILLYLIGFFFEEHTLFSISGVTYGINIFLSIFNRIQFHHRIFGLPVAAKRILPSACRNICLCASYGSCILRMGVGR